MVRFTIRDVLWLMVVVGMLLAWCVDHVYLCIQLDDYRKIVSDSIQVIGT